MRITLTGRRLALAAVVVLAGAAAPLAWATVAGKGGSTPAAAASPARFSMAPRSSAPRPSVSVSPNAATATADNPYQVSVVLSLTANQSACFPVGLPAGNFGFTQASALTTMQVNALVVRVFVKTGAFPDTNAQTDIYLPLTSFSTNGFQSFDFVVKPNPIATAAIGDVHEMWVCVSNGSGAGTATFILTGQKLSTPTAVSVSDFTARPRAQGALLRWTTASENNLLGFNVWRYRGAKGVKLNRTLVRAKRSGEPKGASYRFADRVRGAKRGLTYRLQLVDLNGRRNWYAAFAIASK